MKTGKVENLWDFFFQESSTLKGYQFFFKKLFMGTLKVL
jgi:hypothetical protein